MKALALTILGILAVIVFVGILGSLFPDRPPTYEVLVLSLAEASRKKVYLT